jgi:hypothetical protein
MWDEVAELWVFLAALEWLGKRKGIPEDGKVSDDDVYDFISWLTLPELKLLRELAETGQIIEERIH